MMRYVFRKSCDYFSTFGRMKTKVIISFALKAFSFTCLAEDMKFILMGTFSVCGLRQSSCLLYFTHKCLIYLNVATQYS